MRALEQQEGRARVPEVVEADLTRDARSLQEPCVWAAGEGPLPRRAAGSAFGKTRSWSSHNVPSLSLWAF
jgi:hypothetical protein